jgi:hypothetical protein
MRWRDLMRHVLAITLVAVGLLGCQDEPAPAPQEERTWVPTWKQLNPLSVPRQGLAAVEVNGFIYAMGGALGTEFLSGTEYAKIQPDGSLGRWQPGPPMHDARGYFDAVFYEGYIYVVGGGNGEAGQNLLRTVERARVQPDGSLAAWEREAHEMVMPRRCAKIVLIDGSIYAVGGFGGDMLNSVEHTRIKPGGGTEEWLEEPERLTTMRYISGVKSVDGIVYVVGNHEQEKGASTRDVEWSTPVDEAGFGKWQPTSPLRVARYGLGVAVHGDNLYAIGGLDGPEFLDSIEVAHILAEGGLGPWRMLEATLSSKRAMMAIVPYGEWIYSLGGAGSDTVEYATFNEAGEIGSWLSSAELAAFEAERAAAQAEPPLVGTVFKVMHASPYVYLQVQVTGSPGLVWLAGPEGDYERGDRVRFGGGAMMRNFFSKQLDMRFDSVLFVSEMQKAEPQF